MHFPSFISHTTLCYSNLEIVSLSFRTPEFNVKPSLQAKVPSWYFHFHLKFSNINYLSCSSSSQARVTSPKSLTFEVFPIHATFNLNLGLFFFTSWNIVVQCLGSEWPWSNRCPILLGCHLIYRNIKSIIMFHLLWVIYLCFDQIIKNIWNTKTHIYVGGKTWGREIINAPWGHWWFLSLDWCCRVWDAWWWYVGFPNHLAPAWLWAKWTLWIRHIPQSTRIIVPSRTSRTRSHSLRAVLYIILLCSFIHSSLTYKLHLIKLLLISVL